MKKKITVFSGAGLDRESGILTFRDSSSGLWNNYKIEDVATPEGWKKDREAVLNFYNDRRRQLPEVEPNDAHKALCSLEEMFDVNHLTQNVSDLLERAGCSNILHLHGELTKARGCLYNSGNIPVDSIIDIGYNDINIGDKCKISDSQLRPHIVWFDEMPLSVDKAYERIYDSDYLLIIGTSLQISYTINILTNIQKKCKVIYIDPDPSRWLDHYGVDVQYVKKNAVEGVSLIVDMIKTEKI